VLFYRAAVDLSRSTLNYLAGLIRRKRAAIGSPWRRLNPGQQSWSSGQGHRCSSEPPSRPRMKGSVDKHDLLGLQISADLFLID
jgi:hypothetical protein